MELYCIWRSITLGDFKLRILYTGLDGGVLVVGAAAKSDLEKVLGLLTDEGHKAHVWERSIPADAVGAVEIDDAQVLPDREFRNAWKQSGKAIGHDLIKAKAIQLERIREARSPKLAELDREYMIADEKGNAVEKADVGVRKQLLRDITGPLKALEPTDIQQIKDAFPSSLKD